MLTGMPVNYIDSTKDTEDVLWQKFDNMDKKNWVIIASNRVQKYGLPSGHAYSLMGTAKLTDGTELLKVRNPWGSEVYDGPYSDEKLTES